MIRSNGLILAASSALALITSGAFTPVHAQWQYQPYTHSQQMYQYQQMMLQQQMLRMQMLQQQSSYQLSLQQQMRQQIPYQQPVVQPFYVPVPVAQTPMYSNQVTPKVQVWSGNESLAGYGALTFRLFSNGKAVMVDAKETMNGTWARNSDTITLTFGGSNIVYTGTLDGKTMTGSASDGRNSWTFSVSRP